MGGIGSSRWKNHQKLRLVEKAMALDLRHPKLKTLLTSDRAEGRLYWSDPRTGRPTRWADFLLASVNPDGRRNLVLDRTGDEYEDNEVIALELRPAGFSSYWFAGCRSCGNAVRTLFTVNQNDRFRCRICSDLTYASVQAHDARVDLAARDPEAFIEARARAPRTLRSHCVTYSLAQRALERMAQRQRGRTWGRRSTTSWTRAIDEMRRDYERHS